MFDRSKSGHERLENRPQRSVTENHFVFGVIHDVGHLLGKQTKVQGVQHAARARCSKIQLEVPCRVPREGCHTSIFRNFQDVEHSTQQPCAIGPCAVSCSEFSGGGRGDDAFVSAVALCAFKQMHERELCRLH